MRTVIKYANINGEMTIISSTTHPEREAPEISPGIPGTLISGMGATS